MFLQRYGLIPVLICPKATVYTLVNCPKLTNAKRASLGTFGKKEKMTGILKGSLALIWVVLSGIVKIDTKQMMGTWILKGYEVQGKVYPPETAAQKDFITFFTQGTFCSVSEGEKEVGHWKFNEQTSVLRMLVNGKVHLEGSIVHLTATTLVVHWEVAGLEEVNVHYKRAVQ